MNNDQFQNSIKKVTHPLPGSIPKDLTYQLSVKLKYDNYTLLDMYANLFPHQKATVWKKRIEEGLVKVNGETVKPNFKLKAGWITQNTVLNKIEPDVNPDINLIYDNEDFLVINKPAPIPVHPAGRYNQNTVTEILKLAFPNQVFKITHRIDANTTGLLVLAKTKNWAHQLTQQFEKQIVDKTYLALVNGVLQNDEFEIEQSISKHKTKAGGREIGPNGQQANTVIKVLKRLDNQTLLTITPKSGRTNQIRLHLASIGHPIVGDVGYQDPTYFENNPLTYPTDSLFLHAYKLSFFYQEKQLSFEAPIPVKFQPYL
ncbi:MAG: RluA family pseudouridine synthase [Putridiphycobacter sp.]